MSGEPTKKHKSPPKQFHIPADLKALGDSELINRLRKEHNKRNGG